MPSESTCPQEYSGLRNALFPITHQGYHPLTVRMLILMMIVITIKCRWLQSPLPPKWHSPGTTRLTIITRMSWLNAFHQHHENFSLGCHWTVSFALDFLTVPCFNSQWWSYFLMPIQVALPAVTCLDVAYPGFNHVNHFFSKISCAYAMVENAPIAQQYYRNVALDCALTFSKGLLCFSPQNSHLRTLVQIPFRAGWSRLDLCHSNAVPGQSYKQHLSLY